jgi:hypothetical protein
MIYRSGFCKASGNLCVRYASELRYLPIPGRDALQDCAQGLVLQPDHRCLPDRESLLEMECRGRGLGRGVTWVKQAMQGCGVWSGEVGKGRQGLGPQSRTCLLTMTKIKS